MGHTYSLRFRLRPTPDPMSPTTELVESMFAVLDELGVADDVSEVGPDGTYALWLEVLAADPEAAVGQAIEHLYRTQELTRPDSEPDEIVSIEILVGSSSSSDEAQLPAAI